MKTGGGAAGQNGIRSIAAHIGPDFRRVRIGIGHPGAKDRVLGYVLGDFSKADQEWVEPMLDAMADAAPLLAEGKDATFANKVHLALNPEPAKKPKTEE
jgi:PTH1 family peptidyl-tRNA hydrolase